MPRDLSRQAKNLSHLKPVGEQHPCRFAATDQVDLGSGIERLDLGEQGADQHGIAESMIGPADQHAMDAARRQLAGLAQLPAHGGKQTAKKQGDGAVPQRIAASQPDMDGWLLALWQFGNVIHRSSRNQEDSCKLRQATFPEPFQNSTGTIHVED
ncbi:hypothetical protein [Rhodanobacter glycinis]|uniref:hypothetical protein n=1 Tax=Rhodanobacter glycinis TaxID=582702 RepID=UPI001F5031C2|nr:hypothetical protein [Rhodanobacter glycinis]